MVEVRVVKIGIPGPFIQQLRKTKRSIVQECMEKDTEQDSEMQPQEDLDWDMLEQSNGHLTLESLCKYHHRLLIIINRALPFRLPPKKNC